jgi:hypothetical protein
MSLRPTHFSSPPLLTKPPSSPAQDSALASYLVSPVIIVPLQSVLLLAASELLLKCKSDLSLKTLDGFPAVLGHNPNP